MTSHYVSMSTKHPNLLKLFSTSSCVNLVAIALTVLKLHRGLPKGPPHPVRKGSKKPGLNWVKIIMMTSLKNHVPNLMCHVAHSRSSIKSRSSLVHGVYYFVCSTEMAIHLKTVILTYLLTLMVLMEEVKPVLAKKGKGLKQRTQALENIVSELQKGMKELKECKGKYTQHQVLKYPYLREQAKSDLFLSTLLFDYILFWGGGGQIESS